MATATVTVTRTSLSAPWGIILGEAPLGLVIRRCVPGSPAAQSSVPCGVVVGLGSRRLPVPATVNDFRVATASLTTVTLKVFSSAPKLAPVPNRTFYPRRCSIAGARRLHLPTAQCRQVSYKPDNHAPKSSNVRGFSRSRNCGAQNAWQFNARADALHWH